MLDEMKFGEFITVKRQQANLSMRELCRMTSLSPSFFCKMESGKRPAPSGETQLIIARALNMTEAECIMLFDLAAETKRDGTLPYDISHYINHLISLSPLQSRRFFHSAHLALPS